jgi:hypothetical protein
VQAALAAVSCIAANYIDIVGVTGSIPVSPTTGQQDLRGSATTFPMIQMKRYRETALIR